MLPSCLIVFHPCSPQTALYSVPELEEDKLFLVCVSGLHAELMDGQSVAVEITLLEENIALLFFSKFHFHLNPFSLSLSPLMSVLVLNLDLSKV